MITRREFGRLTAGGVALVSGNGWAQAGKGASKMAAATGVAKQIDRAWVKKTLINDLLDYWLKASVMPNGFIQENLDREWKPFGTQREASLNGQGRQLYCMVAGYEHSRDKRYLDAVTKCADFLIKMRDPQYGGYFNRTTPDLKVIDDTKTGYTSFTIFPLAHAARVTGKKEYADAALQSWNEVSSKMRDGQFFYNSMKRDFSGTAPMTIGNPSGAARPAGQGGAGAMGGMVRRHGLNVHMFEALLALYETTKSKEVWNEIQTEMTAFEKMYDYKLGYLPEGYDENWKAPEPKIFNVGHLFEWGSLFSRAVELGADKKFIELGNRSVDLGLKVGFHKPTGGTWMIANADGSGPAREYMIWWTQCETMKATARYATLHGRSDLWPIFHQATDFVKDKFMDHEYGGWFEGVIPGQPREALGDRAYLKGAVDGPELGSYHQTTMFTDLLHLTA
jgi:mannose/cellobiose epimerase-like protein (N-acyl-D-glucosamine 2-epimerase family)